MTDAQPLARRAAPEKSAAGRPIHLKIRIHMSFSEEHERLVAIETALGCLLFEVIKSSKNPADTRDSFAAGMREAAAAYPAAAMTANTSSDGIVRAIEISSAIEQLLGELLETIRIAG